MPRGGVTTYKMAERSADPHLMDRLSCQFWPAAMSLGYIVQWQRHGLEAVVLFQGLCHIQQAQSRCVVPVPDHRPGPHQASAGAEPRPTLWLYPIICLISMCTLIHA